MSMFVHAVALHSSNDINTVVKFHGAYTAMHLP